MKISQKEFAPFFSVQQIDTEHFLGTAPSVFVGRYNYPYLNVGILAPPEVLEGAELYDAPREWSARNFQIRDVLQFRSTLINSRFQTNIKAKPKLLEITQEVAMASKPTEVEFFLDKKPVYKLETTGVETVIGAHAGLKKAILTENSRIDRRVDAVVSDTDFKAADALSHLYQKGYDETFLARLLSVGVLGVNFQRKIVPTRWSITAVDDTLGKMMIDEVKQYSSCDYQFAFGGYLGNYFLVLFFPRVWSFELFEMSISALQKGDVNFTRDYELYEGRKGYATECVGGYYAARLGILETFDGLKRQGAVLVLRFITDDYTAPLGVWVVREATRRALQQRTTCSSEAEMLKQAQQLVLAHFKVDIESLLSQSKVLEHIKTQKTLKDF